MKGGGGGVAVSVTGKRRWRGLVIGVLFLVILSMLVPLAFLLGLHNGFHSSNPNPNPNGYVPLRHTSVPDGHLKSPSGAKNATFGRNATKSHQDKAGLPLPIHMLQRPLTISNKTKMAGPAKVTGRVKVFVEEDEKCQLKFGSYCLWRKEHREDMKDSMVKKLKDQLFVARAYYPSIAKLPTQDKLTRELKQNIQELEKVFSESSTDADLPPQIEKKSKRMEAAIARAKSFQVECNNVDKKLRQILDMTEDESNFHMKQSAFLYQLAIQTMPKSLHCLSMRLTVEYFRSPPDEPSQADKYTDPLLHHFVIFSNNVLASSVVINSTVLHAKESHKLVFHVLTDQQNFYAMKQWFLSSTFKEATIQVLNIEELNLNYHDKKTSSQLLLPTEFRVHFQGIDYPSTHGTAQYISVFSNAHYLLPDMFHTLKKVVVLDDDIVVQQDLSHLWNLNMDGKVNGATQFCTLRLGQLKSYLGESSFNESSCAWMSGLNVIDLVRWRELRLSETYQKFANEMRKGEGSRQAVALRATLLTFQDQVYALDDEWSLSGLGHDYGLDIQAIKKAAVLHYNGNMKPWLELGIREYKRYWKKFLSQENQFLAECNVNR